jgi:hypothetical protein
VSLQTEDGKKFIFFKKRFGNTKVVGQKELDTFREELKKKVHDPYTVLMKQAKIPFSLLQESKVFHFLF